MKPILQAAAHQLAMAKPVITGSLMDIRAQHLNPNTAVTAPDAAHVVTM